MNGPHDMGGMQCYGPVKPEVDEPVFHSDWEKTALALTVGMGFTGMWSIDASRFARESLPPRQYVSSSYYQIWLAGLEKLVLERGMVSEAELESGKVEQPPITTARFALDRAGMKAGLAAGGPSLREINGIPAFAAGDRVRTRNLNPPTHVRLPRYARAKTGRVLHCNGAHVFPDSNATGEGENPSWLYTVEFSAQELFGSGSHSVALDLWEPYLEAVPA
jgi:nitrile hydratase